MHQIPLPLFDDKPAAQEHGAQQLVEIREYLHVWNDAEREKRVHAASTSSGHTKDQSSGCMSLRVT